jgi:hypothetical protein
MTIEHQEPALVVRDEVAGPDLDDATERQPVEQSQCAGATNIERHLGVVQAPLELRPALIVRHR